MGRTYRKERTANKVRCSRRAERATKDCERELSVEEKAQVLEYIGYCAKWDGSEVAL